MIIILIFITAMCPYVSNTYRKTMTLVHTCGRNQPKYEGTGDRIQSQHVMVIDQGRIAMIHYSVSKNGK